jgi:hypothetical protein
VNELRIADRGPGAGFESVAPRLGMSIAVKGREPAWVWGGSGGEASPGRNFCPSLNRSGPYRAAPGEGFGSPIRRPAFSRHPAAARLGWRRGSTGVNRARRPAEAWAARSRTSSSSAAHRACQSDRRHLNPATEVGDKFVRKLRVVAAGRIG